MNSRKLFLTVFILMLVSSAFIPLAAETPHSGEKYIYIFPGDGDMNSLEFTFSRAQGGYVLSGAPYVYGEIVIPDNVNGWPVVEIGDYAFYGNRNLRGELYLPQTIRRIGEFAFAECSLTGDIFLPHSVEKIGEGAFFSSSFDGALFLSDKLEAIPDYAFARTSLTGPLVIGGNIKEIGEGAFMYCDFSGTLILSEGLVKIGASAFEGNEKLDSDILLPESLVTLSASAFNYCSGLNGHYIMNGKGAYVMRGLDKVEVKN